LVLSQEGSENAVQIEAEVLFIQAEKNRLVAGFLG
jgi:hypothetical protein